MKVVNNITFILILLHLSRIFSNNISINHAKSNHHYNYSIDDSIFFDEMLNKTNKTDLISKYNNDNINSVHLSSNILFNKLYLDECLKCKKDDVKDYCCIGSYYNLTCLYMNECNDLMNKEDRKVITLVFSLYFSVLVIFSFVTGVIIWFLSLKLKNKRTSLMNGLYIFISIIMIGTFIPFIVALIVKLFTKINYVEYIKADFSNLTDNYVLTADTIENSNIIRQKSRTQVRNLRNNSENSHNINYSLEGNKKEIINMNSSNIDSNDNNMNSHLHSNYSSNKITKKI